MKRIQSSAASAVAANSLLKVNQIRPNVAWVAGHAETTVPFQVKVFELRQQREIHLDSRDFIVVKKKYLQFPVVLEEISRNELDAVSVNRKLLQF
jgi:hypothetical protein